MMKKINDVRKLAEEQATHLSDNISETSADDLKQMFRFIVLPPHIVFSVQKA
jgi:hypothetical protein